MAGKKGGGDRGGGGGPTLRLAECPVRPFLRADF